MSTTLGENSENCVLVHITCSPVLVRPCRPDSILPDLYQRGDTQCSRDTANNMATGSSSGGPSCSSGGNRCHTTTTTTTTASLQNNVAVLLLRRNNHETDENEIRSNVSDAVRRFRRAISLTTGKDGNEDGEGQGDDGGDDRGLAWFHRRLLAGEQRTSSGGGAGGGSSSRSLLGGSVSAGIGAANFHSSAASSLHYHGGRHHGGSSSMRSLLSSTRSFEDSQQNANTSAQSMSQSFQLPMSPSPESNAKSIIGVGGISPPQQQQQQQQQHQPPSTPLYGGCAGAAAVLGSPMRTPRKLATVETITGGRGAVVTKSLGASATGRRRLISAGGIQQLQQQQQQQQRRRRRDSHGHSRSESFPAHCTSSRNNSTSTSTSTAAFFGLPPVPPLFESDDNAEALAAGSNGDDGQQPILRMGPRSSGSSGSSGSGQRPRAESFFLPSTSSSSSAVCMNSSFSATDRSSPPPNSHTPLSARPRSKSFALPTHHHAAIPPPPLNEESSTTGDNMMHGNSSSSLRMQEYREIWERSRREAIVADVVTQTAYHVPVADEVTPFGLEYIGEYVSVVLPKKSANTSFGGSRNTSTGGEWAQAVRRNLKTGAVAASNRKDEEEKEERACDADVAASARINLAAVLYYGFIGASDFDAATATARTDKSNDADTDCREEEKKEASVKDGDDGANDEEDVDVCDEERRLDLALTLLKDAAEEASLPTLKTMANVNAGVVLFRRNKVRDAFATFKKARECIDSADVAKCGRLLELPHATYLRSGTLLNVATLAVRLGALDMATEAANEIDGGEATSPLSAGVYRAPRGGLGSSSSIISSGIRPQSSKPPPFHVRRRIRWLQSVSSHHVRSLIQLRRPPGPPSGSDSDSDANDDARLKKKPTAVLDAYASLLAAARKELGHSHPVVGSILFHRGDALFDKHQLHPAMLSYLAALKVMECHTGTPDPYRRSDRLTYSRIWYGIARTLHDREEFPDALRAYQRTLELQTSLTGGSDVCVNVVQTLCNVGRVRHALGDLDGALEVHRRVVRIATALTGGRTGHPFVAARLRALGNLLVEAGRPAEAVRAYAEAARGTGEVCVGFREEDADGTESARQSARVLARAGLPPPCAATA